VHDVPNNTSDSGKSYSSSVIGFKRIDVADEVQKLSLNSL
jgi:hypothetical protein